MNRLAPLMSSAKDDWQTPDNVLELVRQVAPIGLDPCTVASNPTGAEVFFTPSENGLSCSWDVIGGQELIYVNPPYGRGIGKWIDRCRQAATGTWQTIVALVPARTDTKWWHSAEFRSVCFWRGRLTFRGALSVAPFPSALLYWGRNLEGVRFREVFSRHGLVY